MSTESPYPRYASADLEEALEDSPIVLIHGPRQCGKTTLAQIVGAKRGYQYFNLDDATTLEEVRFDPQGFVGRLPERSIIDEVQRAPLIFNAMKTVVDRDRRAGRFIITGSTNVLLLPTISDSLAGRMSILRLHPLSRCEITSHNSSFIDALYQRSFTNKRVDRLGAQLASIIVKGGFPPALARKRPRRRAAWYRDYVEAIGQRDIVDLSRISSLDAIPRLLQYASGQTAQLSNINELSAPFQLTRQTITSYMTLLERLFLVEMLPAWFSNRSSRLVKRPKLHVVDTGIACALIGLDESSLYAERAFMGQMLETFVYQELRRQASWHSEEVRFYHFRNKDKVEVDIVLERGGRQLVGIEVKAAASVGPRDFRGLDVLRRTSGDRFVCGIVLYDGETVAQFGEDMFAVPIRTMWEQ
jgi:uncharacterized protein